MFLKKIKYWFRIKLGLCRCSGYGVYPNGIKCCGCSDCRPKKLRLTAKLTGGDMNKIIWCLKQLLPLTYRSEYTEDGEKIFHVFRMWFGKCFDEKRVVLK